jgi:hypothetical protein
MLTDVSEVRTASIIALMMAAVRTPETSVNIHLTTRQDIAEDSKLHNVTTLNNNKTAENSFETGFRFLIFPSELSFFLDFSYLLTHINLLC